MKPCFDPEPCLTGAARRVLHYGMLKALDGKDFLSAEVGATAAELDELVALGLLSQIGHIGEADVHYITTAQGFLIGVTVNEWAKSGG